MRSLFRYLHTKSNYSADFLLFKHMLATPLTTLQLCLHDTAHPTAAKLQVTAVQHSLAHITNVYQYFSQPDTLPHTQFSVVTSIQEVTAHFAAAASLVQLQIIGDKLTDWTVTGNQFLLQEALLCLIKNGHDAYTTTQHKPVVVTIWQNAQSIFIGVRDFGTGFNFLQQKLAQFWFYTNKTNGTGVGLSFATEVIENVFAGTIHIHSSKGLGTEIVCCLPIHR